MIINALSIKIKIYKKTDKKRAQLVLDNECLQSRFQYGGQDNRHIL